MKVIARVDGIRIDKIDANVARRLQQIIPSSHARTYACEVSIDDPRWAQLKECLDSSLERWDGQGERDLRREYKLKYIRHFEPSDFEGHDYVSVESLYQLEHLGYSDPDFIRLDEMLLAQLVGEPMLHIVVLDGSDQIVVDSRLRSALEALSIPELHFGTVQLVHTGTDDRDRWDNVGGKWFRLHSRKTTPVQLANTSDEWTLYADRVVRFPRAAISNIAPFDIAWIPANDAEGRRTAPLLAVSRRVHALLIRLGVEAEFRPILLETS